MVVSARALPLELYSQSLVFQVEVGVVGKACSSIEASVAVCVDPWGPESSP